jgi:hypothetical protein
VVWNTRPKPPGQRSGAAGFTGRVTALTSRKEPVNDFPQKKKQRVFLVTDEVGTSERAHGMIVKYVPDTQTTLHAHPDAESLFPGGHDRPRSEW